MSSRMDRYNNTKKRSVKNADLYRSIYDDIKYSNIEGVADIEKTNEIDISKIKEMLKTYDVYGRENKNKVVVSKPTIDEIEEQFDDSRSYDITDVLNKAKSDVKSNNKYHSVKSVDLDFIDKLKNKEKNNQLEELNDLNKLADKELSLDLLDDLKGGNTSLDVYSNKNDYDKEDEKDLDNSFFTAGYNFNAKDFEDLKNIDHQLKRNNKLISILITIVLIVVVGLGFYFLYKFLK